MRPITTLLSILAFTSLSNAGEVKNQFSEKERSWWAVQPLSKPTVPKAGDQWALNPIDHFVASKLEESALAPAPKATPEELLRRIYFDLHGLPPTAVQQDEFLSAWKKDPAKAWDNLIDKLLADHHYGERWASQWLDVVRYAETDGYRADGYRPTVYLYRDYVIKSLNNDKPYDQFVKEQLAGDELYPDDPDKLIATAYLRHGVYEWNQRNAEMQWELIINEMTRVTGEVFMGLGVGCAQCHDHKFDPILRKDYYSLQSFLSSVWWPEDRKLGTKAQFDEIAKWEEKNKGILARLQEIEDIAFKGSGSYQVKMFPPKVQDIYNKQASERTTYEEQIAQLVERQVQNTMNKSKIPDKLKKKPELLEEYNKLTKELEETAGKKPSLPDAFITVDIGNTPARTVFKSRTETTEVQPAFLTLLGQPAPKIKPTQNSTGRRTALANWITQKDNPLSTRVIVNRVWQGHFGTGIVPTPNDFGTLGEPPSHPELLDWLTQQFLDNSWSLKSLHKLILQSATYQQTARVEPTEKMNNADPTNRLLWRYPPRRLSAEQARDAMLAISGELQEKTGGASVDGSTPARSVYLKKRRNSPDSLMACFDAPDGFDSAAQRLETNTPTQALLMLNDDWPLKRATSLAANLNKKYPDQTSRIKAAYKMAYARNASKAEVAAALAYIKGSANAKPDPVEPEDKPVYKYPNENGLRPVTQHFKDVEGLGLGNKTLWLQPGSRFEQLEWKGAKPAEDSFTIEVVTILDAIYKDASVNSLVSRWDGKQSTPGWNFGVTSEKSRYQPRNFILQLIGENSGGNMVYEVVASNLRVPLGKPVYLAATVKTDPQGKSVAHFYMKDLSEKDSQLETATVDFTVANRLQDPDTPVFVGGRNQTGHLWDGQLARLVYTEQPLTQENLLVSSPEAPPARLVDWKFDAIKDGLPHESSAWYRRTPPAEKPSSPQQTAFVDFCHAILNSNEFLYLH